MRWLILGYLDGLREGWRDLMSMDAPAHIRWPYTAFLLFVVGGMGLMTVVMTIWTLVELAWP